MKRITREALEERRRTLAALASVEKKLSRTSKREELDRPERESELIAEALLRRAERLEHLRQDFENAGFERHLIPEDWRKL